MNPFALLRTHVWSMPPEHLAAFLGSCHAVAGMMSAVGPMERAIRARDGERVLQADIAGDTASLHLSGVLMTGVPWWAYAYGMDITDLAEATAILGELAVNPKVKTVFLSIDSPGGQATAAGDAAQAVAALAATGKTVQVSASGMLCSAAYWIAAAAGGDITVTPTTIVGSIGTYLVLEDSTAADAKAGYSYTLVASGGVKGHGADGKVTPTLQAEQQALVDGLTALFVAGVAQGRDMTVDAVRALATGRVWLGADAKAVGLVDGVTGAAVDPAPTADKPAQDKPTVAAPAAPAATATTQPPAVVPATTHQEQQPMTVIVAIAAAALAAIAAKYPDHSKAILNAAAEKDATEATVLGAVADAQAAELVTLRADLAKANKATADAETALAAAKGHAQDKDPGGGDEHVAIIPRERAASLTTAEYDAIKAGKAKLGESDK